MDIGKMSIMSHGLGLAGRDIVMRVYILLPTSMTSKSLNSMS
jgi:hypothetical protein